MKDRHHILVVEDELGIALTLYSTLSRADYKVVHAKTGRTALRKAANQYFDLILLDLGLPDFSGLEVCRRLRAESITAPIIILTGDGTLRSKLSLFDAGATDYMTKPFNLEELLARIKAGLRPQPDYPNQPPMQVGELILHPARRSVERAGMLIELRKKEFALMEYFMQHPGEVVDRTSLAEHAWGSKGGAWTNTIDVHIKHLRDKVDRPFAQPVITTVHGYGYKLVTSRPVAKRINQEGRRYEGIAQDSP